MKNKRRNSSKKNRIPAPAARAGSAAPAPAAPLRTLLRWYAGRAPLLHFGVKFCALITLFYLVLLLPACQRMVHAVTLIDARLCGAMLNLIGQHNRVIDGTLWSGDKAVVTVLPLCSGFEFLCLFSAAVLVFPAPLAKKLPGMLVGVALLLALNLIRIMSLFFIGIHYPNIFTVVHEEIWAMILVIASIVLYVAWIRWAGPATRPQLDVPA